MNVDVSFINSEGREDETQFSIKAYDTQDLSDLFNDFCKENNFKRDTVFAITVVEMADTMDELS